jgi:hypothetical protein
MRANGFTVDTHDVGNKDYANKPYFHCVGSCHTALVNGYAIEDHVPAQDIKRFIKERPHAIGLTRSRNPGFVKLRKRL